MRTLPSSEIMRFGSPPCRHVSYSKNLSVEGRYNVLSSTASRISKMHTTCYLKGANTLSISNKSLQQTTGVAYQALTTEASTKHSLAIKKRTIIPFSSSIKASHRISSTTKPTRMPQDFWSPLPRWWCGHCNGPYYRGPGGPMTQGLHKHCFNCHRRRDIYSTPPPPPERPRRQ